MMMIIITMLSTHYRTVVDRMTEVSGHQLVSVPQLEHQKLRGHLLEHVAPHGLQSSTLVCARVIVRARERE